ncbi:CU044_5270 family protein [Streptomyces sp. 4N509B]|uniref:CU044_5270 family protein n=1 Tax=Streptomyces sp. 4N509B TaxID=3457413 RepID=UPI003FD2F0EF
MTRNRNLWWRRRHEHVGHEELTTLLPPPGEPVLPDDRAHRIEEHLMNEITREPAGEGERAPAGQGRRPARFPARRLSVLAAPLAVAAVVGGVVLSGLSSDGSGGGLERDGDAPVNGPLTLELASHHIARAAAAQDVPVPGPDQYVFHEARANSLIGVQERGEEELTWSMEEWGDNALWISLDGWDGMSAGGREEDEEFCFRVGSRWETETDDVAVVVNRAPGCDETPGPDEGEPRPDEPAYGSYDWAASLPTDPEALLDELYEWTEEEAAEGENTDSYHHQLVFKEISRLVTDTLMPAAQTAAMFEAAALVPGVELVEDTTDSEGRDAIALARDLPAWNERGELLFDAESYLSMGSRSFYLQDEGEFEAGDLISESTVLEWAVTDELGERPGATS